MTGAESNVPQDVIDTAAMARDLHAKLYPQEPVTPPDTQEAIIPDEVIPPDDPIEPAAVIPDTPSEEETFEKRYKSLQGKFNKLTEQIKNLEQRVATPAPADPPADETPSRKQEILSLLKEKYDDDLIDYLAELQRLEADDAADRHVQPLKQKAATSEEQEFLSLQDEFVSIVETASPKWTEIWTVAKELQEGLEPSDDKIVDFLLAPDPSGLYRNYDLIHLYEQNFDAEKFAKICNLFEVPAAPPVVPDARRSAMIAPARVRTSPTVPATTDKKIWTMKEFGEFNAACRAGTIDDATKAELWQDVQSALAEGRIRG